jgi:hypothetical protein
MSYGSPLPSIAIAAANTITEESMSPAKRIAERPKSAPKQRPQRKVAAAPTLQSTLHAVQSARKPTSLIESARAAVADATHPGYDAWHTQLRKEHPELHEQLTSLILEWYADTDLREKFPYLSSLHRFCKTHAVLGPYIPGDLQFRRFCQIVRESKRERA